MVQTGRIITYYAPEKSGKTTFGFSGPLPQLHIDFDMGRHRAISRFPREVQSQIFTIPIPEPIGWGATDGKAEIAMWQTFEQVYDAGLKNKFWNGQMWIDIPFKSIFIDTGTQMWKADHQEYFYNTVKKAHSSRIQLGQTEYRVPNDRYRSKVLAARSSGKILFISHYETDEREEKWVTKNGGIDKESVKTGRKEHAGFGEIKNLTDIHLYLYTRYVQFQDNPSAIPVNKLRPFARIETPGWATMDMVGMEIQEPTFDGLNNLIAMNGGELYIP